MIYGLDYLGGAKFGDLLVREHPEGWAAGFFANTFGNAWPVIEQLLATGRCPRVRIHAIWDDAHKYNPRVHDPVINKELQRANTLKAKFPNVHVQFSPFCEHTIKGQQLKDLLNRCGDASRNVEIVNCPYTGDLSERFMNEVHGSHAVPAPKFGAYQYSYDGTSCVDADVEKDKAKHQRAQVFYFWHPAFNGKLNGNDKTPRPQRKAWPTAQLIDSIIYLHRPAGEVRLDSKHIWKSHADRHSTPPEPRAYKPVFITPVKAKRVELVADNGQVVATMPYYGPFETSKHRYYLGEYGYIIAEKAKRIHGKPTLKVVANGKQIGIVNAAYRAGSFRG